MVKKQGLLVLWVPSTAVRLGSLSVREVTHSRDLTFVWLTLGGLLVSSPLTIAMSVRLDRRRHPWKCGPAQPRLVPDDGARRGTTDPWSAPVEPGAQKG